MVVLPFVVLASPQWHPHGPPGKWHHVPAGDSSTATASIPAGIFPSSALVAGSTGSPDVSGVAGAGSTGTPKLYQKQKGDVSGVLSGVAAPTGTGIAAGGGRASSAPAASATVSMTSYD